MSIEDLLTVWWFVLFALMVWISVALPRLVVEKAWPSLKDNSWWRDVALTVIPPVIGIIYALIMRQYPFLVDQKSEGVRVGLGMTGGFFASFVVRVVKARLKERTGIDVDPADKV